MNVTIVGCGEAFDERYPNTSALLRAPSATVLFDCGYSVPPRVWSAVPDAGEIDAVYVSHAHADHYFGLPALFGRMWEDGRTRPLFLVSQPAVLDQIRALMDLGYRTLASRFAFRIEYVAAEPGASANVCGLDFRFAPSQHSVTNLSARVQSGGASFCYSGDGMFTRESSELFSGADLLVHEAYWFDTSPVHADIGALIEMARIRGVGQMALVHVQRGLRKNPESILDAIAGASGVHVTMPEPGADFNV